LKHAARTGRQWQRLVFHNPPRRWLWKSFISNLLLWRNYKVDYLSKPILDEHLLLLIRRTLEYRELKTEVRSLRAPTASPEAGIPGIVRRAPAMQEVYKTLGRVADSAATVLVNCESGTGKE
ncbi:MAG: sigma 54-interacting transcriptional regulator, partial [Acidobacteriota bacterium]